MNNDGKVRSDDAILILRKSVGLLAPSSYEANKVGDRSISISLGEVYGKAGKTASIPIKVSDTNILSGGDICISYDPKVLRVINVSSDSEILLESNPMNSGVINIAFACINGLKSEIIAEVKFDVLTDEIASLEFQNVELYGFDTLPLHIVKLDSRFISYSMMPKHSELLQNFPNPFNPDTWIPYQLKEDGEVTIHIFSISGNLVRQLKLGYKTAGLYASPSKAAYWDGKNEAGEFAASGAYLYTIHAGSYQATKKMFLVK